MQEGECLHRDPPKDDDKYTSLKDHIITGIQGKL